ncbi:MAG TPA: hypothetical protein VLB12_07305, partial [Gemmatimonadales bacterium]|nr:hypothetical protein [Gemmatimonadales bacterium]
MSTDKRFELLEQRVATLEKLVRQLAGAALAEGPQEPSPVERPAFVEPPSPVSPPSPVIPWVSGPAPERPAAPPSSPPRPRRARTDSEQWL